MPDDVAAQPPAAASESKPALPENPDRVGEELADDAKIWHIYEKVAKEDDERRTKAWDNGLNNLALFAGLFSAVTTAFIIEAQQEMEPDYAQLTFLVLNATAFGEKFVQQPFIVPSGARTVNCLWVASLVLSLSAALIAIMGKDWIGMYTTRPVCNLRQWAEMRSHRLNCVDQWYMSGVIAAAPVLLHISLLLFGAGLVVFISSDPLTHHLTLGLSLAAGVLYLVTTFSAVVFSTSPFKSPATQMLRAALSVLFSYLRSVVYRPKRNLVVTLLRDINALVVGRADDSTLLPGNAPETRTLRVRRLASAGRAAINYMRNILTSVLTARHSLQLSDVRSRLRSIVSPFRSLPIDDWFLSSTWTDLPIDRRPKLLADALSWLSGASQAPDGFRAVVFALGDLEIGPRVGLHTSIQLRTRLSAELRRTWQQVDLPTLYRYVLAECNTTDDAKWGGVWLNSRFDESKKLASHCEAALAAMVKAFPTYISPYALEQSFPGTSRVTQPRMAEFLLPYILQTQDNSLDVLVVLAHRCRANLRTGESFNFTNLETHLFRALGDEEREAYATEVKVKYGGTPGAIELLTFVCCHDIIGNATKTAAVELIMELMEHSRLGYREHRCLAYLLGGFEPWNVAWADEHRSSFLVWRLAQSLQPSSACTQFGDKQFDLALARTLVMLISPRHDKFGLEHECMVFLSGYLRQPLVPNSPDNDGKLSVIRLILESGALLRIVGMPDYFGYDDGFILCGTAILSEIMSELDRHLRADATVLGRQLFRALVLTEVEGENGTTVTWNLRDWLHTKAPEILKQCPSSATAMQDLHDALVGLCSLCEFNVELRAQWDCIGYPGRPGDIFSDTFLDVGAFFNNAEAPRVRPGGQDIFDDPWLDLTEFFDGAEDGNYRWPDAPPE